MARAPSSAAVGSDGRIRCFLYDADGRDRELQLSEVSVDDLKDDQLLWIDMTLHDADLINTVGSTLSLSPAALQQLQEQDPHNPSLIDYADYLHIRICEAVREGDGFVPVALDCILGACWIVTAHHHEIPFLQAYEDHLEGDSQLGQLDARGFLGKLLDWHLNSYFACVEAVERDIDEIDDRLLGNGRCDDQAVLRQLAVLRRRIAHLRRLLAPHREVYPVLAHPRFTAVSERDDAGVFPVLNDRLNRAIDAVENAREMVIGSYDVFMTQLSQRTNDVVKLLTITSVLLLPLATIAAILGMNFRPLPAFFVGTSHFFITVGLMGCLLVAMVVVARVRHWL